MEEVSEDCSELVAYLRFCKAVTDVLTERGLEATLEYPALVTIRSGDLEYWFGSDNERWGANISRIVLAEDDVPISFPISNAYAETTVSSDCRDVETVAAAIQETFVKDLKARRNE